MLSLAQLPHAIAIVATIVCTVFIVARERGSGLSRLTGGLAALSVMYIGLRSFVDTATDPALALQLSRLSYAIVCFVSAQLFWVCLQQVRAGSRLWPLIQVNWYAAALLGVLAAGTPWLVTGVVASGGGHAPVMGIGGIVFVCWMAAQVGFIDLLLYRAIRMAPGGGIERARLLGYAAAFVLVHLSLMDFLHDLLGLLGPWSYASFALYMVMLAAITRRFGLVTVGPQLVARQLSELIQDGLMILDADTLVRFSNAKAASMLGVERDALKNRPLSALLGDSFDADFIRLLSGEAGQREEGFSFVHQHTDGDRELKLTVTQVQDRSGRHTAYLCELEDQQEASHEERQRQQDRLIDPLTGLSNRLGFQGVVNAALESSRRRGGQRPAALLLGIDRFHQVNEDLGHSVGDGVLQMLSTRLRNLVGPQDVVARVGGDEFAVLLADAGDDSVAETVADTLIEQLRQPVEVQEHTFYLGASIGALSSLQGCADVGDVMRGLGIAMHRAKEGGGARVFVLKGLTDGRRRTHLETELRLAVERREFVTYYQPVVDTANDRISGFEALVRWQHPEKGLLLPGHFIEFAEEIGLSHEIDRLVLEQACVDLMRFRNARYGGEVLVNVNVSEAELADSRFVDDTQAYVASVGVDPSWLQFEILERAALTNAGDTQLNRLAQAGFKLCLDDFGTGYSSLSRLNELPISTLKIDRSFVRSMLLSDGGDNIVRSIVFLAKALNLRLIAEGVSKDLEAARLKRMDCHLFQGFHYSPAVPAAEALEWLERGSWPRGGELDRAAAAPVGKAANL